MNLSLTLPKLLLILAVILFVLSIFVEGPLIALGLAAFAGAFAIS